jgi:S1-C subfamily serine protease
MPASPLRRVAGGRLARTAAVALAAAAIGGGTVALVDVATEPGGRPADTTAVTTIPATTTAPGGGATAVDFSEVYARRRSGVVSITATAETGAGPGPGGEATAGGTGVVIDDEGHVLTNEHVVSGASSVRVELASGRTAAATVVGTDPSTDLALLEIDVPASELDPIPLGDSSTLAVGDPVLAIGDPFGYEGSASAGIVSGLGRTIEAPNGFSITGAIQTDAAVNHGNSGGALLNAAGQLVGIPAQIADSGVDANVGVAFAVPVDTAKAVVSQLAEDGRVEHAWLGVSTATVGADLARAAGLGAVRGALVTGVVADGPADDAGLAAGGRAVQTDSGPVCAGGDVVTAVGDTPVRDASDLQEAVDARSPGDRVALRVTGADGEARTVTVTLGERPGAAGRAVGGCAG